MGKQSNTTDLRNAVMTIKDAILKSQARSAQLINQEQLSLYYGIGRYVSEHSRKDFWGTGAIARISLQLKSELPGLKGFSEENIKLMRRFYEAWKGIEVKSVVRTTENTFFNNSLLPTNSVVETTDLQSPDTEEDTIQGLQLTNDDSFPKADKAYVEYVLQDYLKPIGVATYQQMQHRLRELLPPEDEIKKLL